jgi:hypothetical protein
MPIPLAIWAPLSYKAIRAAINAHDGRSLFCLSPLIGGEESPRTVFVSQELRDIVTPPWPDSWEGRRHAGLRALLDAFTEGDSIAVAEDPHDKAARAILARVDPVDAEVWNFRCLDPRPGIRAFGHFSEPDTFIALTWDYRENLEDGEYWEAEVLRCQSAWRKLFGALPPHAGSSLNAYLSYNFWAV